MKTEITKYNNVSNSKLNSELIDVLIAISKITNKIAVKMSVLEKMEKEEKGTIHIQEISNLAKELNNCGNILVAISEDFVKFQSLRNTKKNS